MCQAKTPSCNFIREFEFHTQDVEMGVEASKVHLMVALNEDTLHNLDAYVILQGGKEMLHLETMLNRLWRITYVCITYVQMLS